jgi:fumarate reductase subunit C
MAGWWRRNPFYIFYMLREATSVFVALYALQLLYGLYTLAVGEAAFDAWLVSLRHPLFLVFHGVALAAALLHAFTWFNVAPKAMPVLYLGSHRVADRTLVWAQYLIFAVISVAILGVVLGG